MIVRGDILIARTRDETYRVSGEYTVAVYGASSESSRDAKEAKPMFQYQSWHTPSVRPPRQGFTCGMDTSHSVWNTSIHNSVQVAPEGRP